jgi:DNA ligase D-like protein (predicted 3'-phosphoesterase)
VLASWAVPKGPSTDPRQKRLAVRVEDHELAHASYENDVEGRGSVVIWDTGTFDNVTERDGEPVSVADALAGGHLKVVLHGDRLQGAYTLQQTRMSGDDRNWLLVKVTDL